MHDPTVCRGQLLECVLFLPRDLSWRRRAAAAQLGIFQFFPEEEGISFVAALTLSVQFLMLLAVLCFSWLLVVFTVLFSIVLVRWTAPAWWHWVLRSPE